MTTLPLRTLALRPGQEERRVVDVDVENFHLGGSEYRVDSPVPVELTVQRAVSGDVLRLRLETTVRGPCMRCLVPAGLLVSVDVRDYEAEGEEELDELHTEYVSDGELDLSRWARDQIAFALPDQILCRPDCAGLCPVCGKDLNVEPHEHDEAVPDARWSALEALRADADRES